MQEFFFNFQLSISSFHSALTINPILVLLRAMEAWGTGSLSPPPYSAHYGGRGGLGEALEPPPLIIHAAMGLGGRGKGGP
jgi:hypothetical protein